MKKILYYFSTYSFIYPLEHMSARCALSNFSSIPAFVENLMSFTKNVRYVSHVERVLGVRVVTILKLFTDTILIVIRCSIYKTYKI